MTDQASGLNFSVKDRRIRFFHTEGVKVSATMWGIGFAHENTFARLEPCSIMDDIRKQTAAVVASGNGHKIFILQLNARAAVIFFLEGKITVDHLKRASEGFDFIDLTSVRVDDRTLRVRIVATSPNEVVIADSRGNDLLNS